MQQLRKGLTAFPSARGKRWMTRRQQEEGGDPKAALPVQLLWALPLVEDGWCLSQAPKPPVSGQWVPWNTACPTTLLERLNHIGSVSCIHLPGSFQVLHIIQFNSEHIGWALLGALRGQWHKNKYYSLPHAAHLLRVTHRAIKLA